MSRLLFRAAECQELFLDAEINGNCSTIDCPIACATALGEVRCSQGKRLLPAGQGDAVHVQELHHRGRNA